MIDNSSKECGLKIVMKSKYVANIIFKDKNGSDIIKTGDKISRGQILFMINYLGVIIEVKSIVEGIVEDIYVSHNSAVEYGQKVMSLYIV